MSFARWVPLLFAAGCLGGAPTENPGPAHDPSGARTPLGPSALMAQATDPGSDPTGAPDLGTAPPQPRDLGGLTDCFGVAVCDPALHFCIKFFAGSAAAPGALAGGPACFEPSQTCGSLNQPMSCSCIQADPQLGANCQGSCADNGDGTYFCYAQ